MASAGDSPPSHGSERGFMRVFTIPEKWWAIVGRAAGVVTLLLFLGGIGKCVFEPATGPSPRAVLAASNFTLPPDAVSDIQTLCSSFTTDFLNDSLRAWVNGSRQADSVFEKLRGRAGGACSGFYYYGPYRSIRTLYVGTVKNEGNRVATSVSLNIPNTVVAAVQAEGRQPRLIENKSLIDIGSIRPNEVVKVSVWSTHAIDPIRPFREPGDAKLLYAGGKGTVHVLVFTNPLFQRLYLLMAPVPTWWWVLMAALVVLAVFSSAFLARSASAEGKSRGDSHDG